MADEMTSSFWVVYFLSVSILPTSSFFCVALDEADKFDLLGSRVDLFIAHRPLSVITSDFSLSLNFGSFYTSCKMSQNDNRNC